MRGIKTSYEGKQWKEKPERHRWSRFSFAELIDKGILRQKYAEASLSTNLSTYTYFVEYLELIESELVRNFRMFDADAHDESHLTEKERSSLTDPLQMAFGDEFRVWLKTPLAIGYYSVVLPRYAVTMAGEPPQVEYRQIDKDKYFESRLKEMPHYSNVVLVIEYSSIDTLTFGGVDKEELYALAGIPEYWVYRVSDRVLEVHRDPVQMQDRRLQYGYRSSQQYSNQESVSLLAAPHSEIAVADIARGVQLARSVW